MCGVFGVYVRSEGLTRGGRAFVLALFLRQEPNLYGLLVYVYVYAGNVDASRCETEHFKGGMNGKTY